MSKYGADGRQLFLGVPENTKRNTGLESTGYKTKEEADAALDSIQDKLEPILRDALPGVQCLLYMAAESESFADGENTAIQVASRALVLSTKRQAFSALMVCASQIQDFTGLPPKLIISALQEELGVEPSPFGVPLLPLFTAVLLGVVLGVGLALYI